MCQGNDKYRQLLDSMPEAFAHNRIILDDGGNPLDYEILDVNLSFEEMTGLSREEITGRKGTEILSPVLGTSIRDNSIDWIDFFGRVASTGKSNKFQNYFQSLGCWYEITVFSHQPGFFFTVFRDISHLKQKTAMNIPVPDKPLTISTVWDVTQRKKAEETLQKSEERFQKMLSLIPDMISIHDPEMNIVYSNWNGFADVPEEKRILNTKCYKTYRGQEKICPDCKAKTVLRTKEPLHTEAELPDGRWIDLRVIPVLDENNNNVELFVEWVRDITDRKQMEKSLENQYQFEKMVSDISSFFVSLPNEDLDRGINYALKLTGELFGVDRSYVLQISADGQGVSNTHEWCREGVQSHIEFFQDISMSNLSWWEKEIEDKNYIHIPDVDSIPPEVGEDKELLNKLGIYSVILLPLVKSGELFGFFGFDVAKEKMEWSQDQINLLKVVSELISSAFARHQVEEEVRYLSFYDRLTKLYNRHYLEEEMQRLDTQRQMPISIIMADVNGLKLVNDTYGHSVGDEMLISAANSLRNFCREEDIISRWGGDEFVILLPQTTREDALVICKRINNECCQEYVKDVPISMSTGVASKVNIEQDLAEVLRDAEDQMYKHKLTESRSGRSAVLNSLLVTLGEKSHETEIHTLRMQTFAFQIGETIKLPESELNRLSLLIPLHDIGKINIPQEVLTKKGPLTPEEWEIIKEHPEIGCRIARATDEFASVAEDIFSHHERWDGSGYPRGLKEEEIPLLARITAIADSYEVMTNGRPYQEVMSKEEAVAELKRCAGSQFDPKLVEAFLSVLKE